VAQLFSLGIIRTMPSPEQVERYAESQIRFLELLRQLTDAGRAEWLQVDHSPGFVHCLVDGEDLIKFECMGGEKGDEHIPPAQQLAGVVSHHCNTTYLWLPVAADWELLLQLLRSARDDAKRFSACRGIAHQAPVRVLEARLKI
jgi:hypothetical protein